MNSSDPFLWNLWLDISNLQEIDYNRYYEEYGKKKQYTFEQLWESEWDHELEKLLRCRLVMGIYRGYGHFGSRYKPQWDRMGRVKKELELYDKDKNLEHMVEIINHCILEFKESGNKYTPSDETMIRLFDPRTNKKPK